MSVKLVSVPYMRGFTRHLCGNYTGEYKVVLLHTEFVITKLYVRLRIILDEGHRLTNTVSDAMIVADQSVTADGRWIVTGSPLSDTIRVEMDLANTFGQTNALDSSEQRELIVQQRKKHNISNDDKAIRSLGYTASAFLQAKPWVQSREEKNANSLQERIRIQSEVKKAAY